jgi:phosphoglucosamine mutase
LGKFFGTDGVRGIANTELTCELAYKIGQAGALVLTQETQHKPTILIGKDTRISGDMLEAALLSGICSVGADVKLLGVVPTPAVAYLTRKYNADAGVVISASHNPMEYNGIKFFNSRGFKLSDEIENHIEEIIEGNGQEIPLKSGSNIGRVTRVKTASDDYVSFLCSTLHTDISGMKIAIDCANGAASTTAAKLFSKLGADVDIFFDQPDGININAGCGSTHMETISKIVREGNYDIGLAFDGDADRCLCVDERGRVIDGDQMIAACACQLKQEDKLKKSTVVVTVMTNMGFFKMAEENGIGVFSTKVGDRYVLEEMINGGYCLGGEQSGHIIFSDYNTTGDGQLTALQFLAAMQAAGKGASDIAGIMKIYPQVMINVPLVSNQAKEECQRDPEVDQVIAQVMEELKEEGRVLVRPSGTEKLIRVMLEGKELKTIEESAARIAQIIQKKYGNKGCKE